MFVSILIIVHKKRFYAKQAISSVVEQTYPNFECTICDSGELYDSGFYQNISFIDQRFKVIRSEETPEVRKTKNVASWLFNRWLPLAKGELLFSLADDDILYPNFFETFVNYFKRNETLAAYASQDVSVIDKEELIIGERRAIETRGSCVGGLSLDCQIDYLQFCFHRSLLKHFNQEVVSENLRDRLHADGIFMEKIGKIAPVYPIGIKVCRNRRISTSTNISVQQTINSLKSRGSILYDEPVSPSVYWE